MLKPKHLHNTLHESVPPLTPTTSQSHTNYLHCQNLQKSFPGSFTLDLSLQMPKGELLCIIGPSGSGKSTLLSLISGVDQPASGRILIDGTDITNLPIQKRKIGMVFQDFSLFSTMDVAENIQFGMKGLDKSQRDAQTCQLLDLVGLSGYQGRRVTDLSGGEAQRIALARAIAANPRILLLDEPLSALDAPLRRRLRTTIRQIHDRTGLTMIYVTHDREEAFAIADRILVLRAGRVQAIGTPEEIYLHPSNLFTAFFTGDGSTIPLPTGRSAFFRPESVVITSPSPPTLSSSDDTSCLVLPNSQLQSCEFTGSDYIVSYTYNDIPITVRTPTKPTSATATLSIPKDRILELN